MVGLHSFEFAAGQPAVVSADLPVASRVKRASRAEPYLALAIELDAAVLLDLAAAQRSKQCRSGGPGGAGR